MALQWQEVGSLKGPQGVQGETGPAGKAGASVRTCSTTITDNSDVTIGVINPSTGIQIGDLLIDNVGAMFAVESVSEGVSVHVGTVLTPNLKGPQGDKGEAGEPGKDGTGVDILGTYESLEALQEAHPTGTPGDAYMIEGNLYVWSATDTAWVSVGPIKGDKGDKGDTGAAGTAATVTVGSVSTGEPGGNAEVTNAGNENAAVLNFTIPRGEQGPKGDQGVMGITFGSGVPSAPSVEGAGYIDTDTFTVYVYKNEA